MSSFEHYIRTSMTEALITKPTVIIHIKFFLVNASSYYISLKIQLLKFYLIGENSITKSEVML